MIRCTTSMLGYFVKHLILFFNLKTIKMVNKICRFPLFNKALNSPMVNKGFWLEDHENETVDNKTKKQKLINKVIDFLKFFGFIFGLWMSENDLKKKKKAVGFPTSNNGMHYRNMSCGIKIIKMKSKRFLIPCRFVIYWTKFYI